MEKTREKGSLSIQGLQDWDDLRRHDNSKKSQGSEIDEWASRGALEDVQGGSSHGVIPLGVLPLRVAVSPAGAFWPIVRGQKLDQYMEDSPVLPAYLWGSSHPWPLLLLPWQVVFCRSTDTTLPLGIFSSTPATSWLWAWIILPYTKDKPSASLSLPFISCKSEILMKN